MYQQLPLLTQAKVHLQEYAAGLSSATLVHKDPSRLLHVDKTPLQVWQ